MFEPVFVQSVEMFRLLFAASYLAIIKGDYGVGVFLYEDMACKPVKLDDKILKYECPPLRKPNGTCQFKDKVYKLGDSLENEFFHGSCTTGCICGQNGTFTCTRFDCLTKIDEGCSHLKYSLDNCCSVGSICGEYKTCEISNRKYKEGERYFRDDTCEECICAERSACRKRRCFDALYYDEFALGAPVFSEEDSCCPSNWITHESEKIIKINQDISDESGLFCECGGKNIKLGYGFEKLIQEQGKVEKFKCECSIPPLLFCRKY